jgi:YbbR domain-containing protein
MPGIDLLRAGLAIILSVVIWLIVQAETNPDRQDVTSFTVPVEVVNAPPGLQVTSDPPPVRVALRAPESVWRRLAPQSLRATADASRAGEGVNDLPVRVEKLDPDVNGIPSAVPATVPVKLERVEEKSVPVRVDISGVVPFGYTYAPPVVQPEAVTVSGPASAVQQVVAAVADIRLDGVTVSVSAAYAPRPVDARSQAVTTVQVVPAAVNVSVQVSQQVTYKQVGVRPVVTGVPASGYYVVAALVDPASATLVGTPASLSGIEFVETMPIDVSNATTTVIEKVDLAVPSGASLLQPQPVTATVRIEVLQVSQTVRVPVTVIGLGAGVMLGSEPPAVDVTISGPSPTLQNLSPHDFQVLLDLSGLGPGEHSVTPHVVAPRALSVDRFSPDTVTVVLVQPTPTATTIPTATPTLTPTLVPTATATATPVPTSNAALPSAG